MTTSKIVESIDSEIDKLAQARTLLLEAASSDASAQQPARSKGSASQGTISDELVKVQKPRRSISVEGKARIASAQKARWAAKKRDEKRAKKSAQIAAEKTAKAAGKKAARGSAIKALKTPTSIAFKATAKKSAKKSAKTAPADNKGASATPVSSSVTSTTIDPKRSIE